MDKLHYADLKKRRKSPGQICRRVDLNRGSQELPEDVDPIYPVLVSNLWLKTHPEAQPQLSEKNPRGFTRNIGTDTGPSSSDSSSDTSDEEGRPRRRRVAVVEGQDNEEVAGEVQDEEEASEPNTAA